MEKKKILLIGNVKEQLSAIEASLLQRRYQVLAVQDIKDERISTYGEPEAIIISGIIAKEYSPYDIGTEFICRFPKARIMAIARCPILQEYHHGLLIEYYHSIRELLKALEFSEKEHVNDLFVNCVL